jgi:hypothetical protein
VPDRSIRSSHMCASKCLFKSEFLAASGQKKRPRPSTLEKGRIFEVFLRRQKKTYNTGIIEAKWPYVQTMVDRTFSSKWILQRKIVAAASSVQLSCHGIQWWLLCLRFFPWLIDVTYGCVAFVGVHLAFTHALHSFIDSIVHGRLSEAQCRS